MWIEIKGQFGVKIIMAPAPAAVVLMDVLRLSENRDHCLFFLTQTYLFLIQDHLFQWYQFDVHFVTSDPIAGGQRPLCFR